MNSKQFIEQHKKSLSLLALCFVAICLPLLVAAQNSPTPNQPSADKDIKVVQRCGYTIKSSPVFFRQPGPVMEFGFSIERVNKTRFDTLKEGNIEVLHDGSNLSIDSGALKNKADESVAAFVLVDVSKSMRRQEFGKLAAVKKALHGFIDSPELRDGDRIAIAKFDYKQKLVQEPTTNRKYLYNAIDQLDGRNGSMLYESLRKSLKQAYDYRMQALILLSDGVDSTPDAVYYRSTDQQDELKNFERSEEAKIIELAQSYGIRIFAVEMGNISEAYSSMYVYRVSPGNISRATGGGEDYYIDLIKLKQNNEYGKLGEELGKVLEEIRQDYKFDYLLPLSVAGHAQPDGKVHTVNINFKFDSIDSKPNKCVIPVEVKYVWYPDKPYPEELSTTILATVFLAPSSMPVGADKNLSEITIIYLIMMVTLAAMSVVPMVWGRLAEERETRQIRRSIIRVGKGSPYIGKECPSERSFRRFHEGDLLLICPDPNCKLPHHLDCWNQAHGRCYRRNCTYSSNPQPLPEALAKSYKLPPVS